MQEKHLYILLLLRYQDELDGHWLLERVCAARELLLALAAVPDACREAGDVGVAAVRALVLSAIACFDVRESLSYGAAVACAKACDCFLLLFSHNDLM